MTSTQPIDRLVILEFSGSQSDQLLNELRRKNYPFTIIDSTGGMFQEPMLCLLLGIEHSRLDDLLKTIHVCCPVHKQFVPAQMRMPSELSSLPMVEAQVGGASIYVVRVEEFVQI